MSQIPSHYILDSK